jgi:predicted nucleotidyltransferase
MSQTIDSRSNTLTLEEVIVRLTKSEAVEGILLIGSANEDSLTPASDYDLVVVLSNMPVPLHVGVTRINHRLTDLIFVSAKEIEEVLALTEPVGCSKPLGRIIPWIQAGKIVFDRSGRLQRCQNKFRTGTWTKAASEFEVYGSCFGVNYNLAQTRRMLASDDPDYRMTAKVRMAIYGTSGLLWDYFTIRRMPWKGEKKALRYLESHDPEYYELFHQFVKAGTCEKKLRLYEQLAKRTTAPAGGLWGENDTALLFQEGTELQPGMVESALSFWNSLISNQG